MDFWEKLAIFGMNSIKCVFLKWNLSWDDGSDAWFSIVISLSKKMYDLEPKG